MNVRGVRVALIVVAAGAVSCIVCSALGRGPAVLIGTGRDWLPDVLIAGTDLSSAGRHEVMRPYPDDFWQGVRVASGDVTGDGVDDIIVGPGPWTWSPVKVFDGRTRAMVRSFLAFPEASFTAGVSVAAGDVTGDGVDDIIAGTSIGLFAHIKVFNGSTGAEVMSFMPLAGSSDGLNVAAGDVNRDGIDDIIVSGGVGTSSPNVRVFDGSTGAMLRSFFAYAPDFGGGIHVAAGDLNGDGFAEIFTGPAVGSLPVKVFDGLTGSETAAFFPFGSSFAGGVRVAVGDVTGDGALELIAGAGSGQLAPGEAHVKAFDGRFPGAAVWWLRVWPDGTNPGVWVSGHTISPPAHCMGDANGDGVVTFADITSVLGNFGRLCK